MSMTFTLQTPTTDNRGFHEALAGEVFQDLDRARLAALELCSCFGVDVELIQHFGAASCVREVYDHRSYGGSL